MEFTNAVYPSEAQMQGFAEDDGQPITMVNLLKFKEKAEYADERETELSGAQAYQLYGTAVAELIQKVGGNIVFAGTVSRLMLGEIDELWDQVAIAHYPSRSAMLEMMQMPEYAEISVHRTAGLKGQLNIETR